MLTSQQNVSPNSCHLLLILLGVTLLMLALSWAFKKVEKGQITPSHKKKRSKHKIPWIIPLEGAGDISTDPEMIKGVSTDIEGKSPDSRSLYHTLRILDRNIQYLAWQMQHVNKPISHSASNSSLDSTTSLCSWAQASAIVHYSQSGTPPSPGPVALKEEVPVWQGNFNRPYRSGFQQPRSRFSYPQMDFKPCKRPVPKPCGKILTRSDSLCRQIPSVPSAVKSSPIHIQRLGSRIYFLDYKEQELLDWHVHKKYQQKEADPILQVPSREIKVQVDIIPHYCVSQQLSTCQRSCSHTSPPPGPKGRQTPPKSPPACVRTPRPRTPPPSPRGRQTPPKSPPTRVRTPRPRTPPPSPRGHQTPPKSPPARVRSPGPCICPAVPLPKDVLPPPLIICQTESHHSQIPPKSPPACVRSPGPCICPTVPLPKDVLPPSLIICQTESHHSQIPPKSPPARVRSPGPCICPTAPLPKDVLPPSLIICQTGSHSSLRALTNDNLGSMAPKDELTEILSLLGQSQNTLPKQLGRPRTPREKKKEVHSGSSSKRPSTPKESSGRASSPKDKPAEISVSLMLDRKTRQLSWANDKIDLPKLSGELPSILQPPFLDPTFMCQNELELPCIGTAQRGLHQETLRLTKKEAKSPPKSQCLAHAIVESLDTEKATQDLHMCLAKILEKGRGRPSVEYPVCLLCGRCTQFCPHPRPRQGPCLLVYPRLSVREGEVYMSLGFLLKIKRQEANQWGLVQGMDASILQLNREGQRKPERHQSRSRTRIGSRSESESDSRSKSKSRNKSRSRSRSRSRKAGEAASPLLFPEKSVHRATRHSPEAIDLSARRHRTAPRPSEVHLTRKPSSKMQPQPQTAKSAPVVDQRGHPKKPLSFMNQLLHYIKKVWAKRWGKKEAPSPKHSHRASHRKPVPSEYRWDPSASSGDKVQSRTVFMNQDARPTAKTSRDAVTPTYSHSKHAYPHGRRRVFQKPSEAELFHLPKKADSHRAKSASLGASKKMFRHSSSSKLRKSPSKQTPHRREDILRP